MNTHTHFCNRSSFTMTILLPEYGTYRCESVRKSVERVFGMIKKSFQVIQLSMLVTDIEDTIEDIIHSCFILHNINDRRFLFNFRTYTINDNTDWFHIV